MIREKIGAASLVAAGLVAAFAVAGSAAAGPARFTEFSYSGQAQEKVTVAPGQYRNPIMPGYYPDPSVTRVGDNFYLVNSSFSHYPGLPVFTSKDLVSWHQVGNAIDRPDQLDFTGMRASQSVFAPDISYHNGIYYIVNTCVSCKGNFVITAKNPAGPWSKPYWLDFEGIDPSIYWEGDKAYIVNNRAPNETPRYDGHRAIWLQEFDWHAMKMTGPSTQIVNGGVDISKKPSWIEGPHLFKRGAYYYLIAAEGGTGDNHTEVVFRSKSMQGPFVPYDKNPILSQRGLDPNRSNIVTSAGHADFVQTPNGDWWAVFLATRPYQGDLYNIGRETFLLPVTWKDGWPQILPAGKSIPIVAERPKLPADAGYAPVGGDYAFRETFDGPALGMEWIGLRTPKTPVYKLENGALVLNHGAPFGDLNGVPAFVGHRQRHHVATISTVISYTPDKEGDRAGLAAVQNDNAYLFFGIARLAGKPVIALYTRDKPGVDTLVASAPLEVDGPVTLTLRANGGTMAFDYATAKGKATLKADLDVTFLSTHKATGFVGTIIGPYAQNQ